MPENKTIEDRLNQIVEDSGLSIQEFAASVEVDRGQFGKILSGKMGITLKQVMKVSSLYGIRTGWILEGEGQKEKSGASQQPDQNLLSQLKTQISTMAASLRTLAQTIPGPEDLLETPNQGSSYQGFGEGKKMKADKQ